MLTKGNSARLLVTFMDSKTKTPINPTNIKLNVYRKEGVLIDGPLDVGDTYKVPNVEGTWEYNYTPHTDDAYLVFEFIGKYQGLDVAVRKEETVRWHLS